MKFVPRPYQHLLTAHELNTPRGAGFVFMGGGKTVATLNAVEARVLLGDDRPTLILAPLRVAVSTWPDEARKWEHLSNIEVQSITGDQHSRGIALQNKTANVFTMNYENIVWLMEDLSRRRKPWPFAHVVCDESTKLKSFRLRQGGKRSAALAQILPLTSTWTNLTGTPAPNGLQDLWGQTYFIDKGQRLGRSFSAFTDRWFRPDWSGYGVVPLPHAQREIEAALRDVCLTIKAEDYFDLKEPVRNVIELTLPTKAMGQYQQMEREFFASIDGTEIEAFNAAAKSMKAMQMANGAAYYGDTGSYVEVHDVKLQALEEIISEAAGVPILVAYNFKSDLDRLQKAFPKGRTLDANPQTITDWNEGKIPLLFTHPASAGHGLNLQDGGNTLVFFGLNWNLEEHEQIIERIGPVRQMQAGHDRAVFIHYLVAKGTIDETILERLSQKSSIQEALLNAMRKRVDR